MEKKIEIPTADGHTIHGVLNSQGESNKLIIFVHGLTGHRNEHVFYNAARFFPQRNFDTFRLSLYTDEEKGRSLIDCTIETHANDVTTVLQYFQSQYQSIFVVGHSLGGPSIILADTSAVNSVALWDPSYNIADLMEDELTYDERIDAYTVNWGTTMIIGKPMVESWQTLGDNMLDKITTPMKVICAGNGILKKPWSERIPLLGGKHELHVIEHAGHCFDEGETEPKLFQETLAWFEQ